MKRLAKKKKKKKNTTEVINPCIWTEKVASQTPSAPSIVTLDNAIKFG